MTRRVRRPRFRTRLAAALLVLGVTWCLALAGSALVVVKEVDRPDAVVMLASHEWERLPAAAALGRRFPATTVLLTVPQSPSGFNCHRCLERVEWLEDEGVPPERVVELPDRTANTYEEARATRNYATARGLRSIVVVTSPYHARRALRAFESVMQGTGIAVGVLPASATSVADPRRWWRHAYDRAYVAYEWAAVVQYRFKYGVPLAGQ